MAFVSASPIHPLIEKISTVVKKYQSQSISHFAQRIDVQYDLDAQPQKMMITQGLKMKVLFQGDIFEKTRTCRPLFRHNEFTGVIQVREKNRWVPLVKSLALHFPADPDRVTEDTMRKWWDGNEQVFNWQGLPTELKDNILQFCACNQHGFSEYWFKTQDYKRRHRRKPGPYEVIDQLGSWRSLLRVSRQVRALVLRLLLVHNDKYPGGLTIVSLSHYDFQDAMKRLGRYLQIAEPDSVPINPKMERLAHQYSNYPKQYPHLSRFATMRHGIRKLYISFDFMDSLHFFKVSVGNLDQYRIKYFMTCDMFEKLPNLDGVHIVLPRTWWRDQVIQMGPQLFHETHPCPRTLHRFIYERAAEVLATYNNIHLEGFMDRYEKQRFWNLYEAAVLRRKFTNEELKELYTECGGGVQLDAEADIETERSNSAERVPGWASYWSAVRPYRKPTDRKLLCFPEIVGDVFPPHCQCEIPCKDAFFFPRCT